MALPESTDFLSVLSLVEGISFSALSSADLLPAGACTTLSFYETSKQLAQYHEFTEFTCKYVDNDLHFSGCGQI